MPKEAIVQLDLSIEIIDTPIPTPGEHDVVIKVIVSGTNPKDWKRPVMQNKPHNSGDDIAGTVHSIGSKVYEFKPGDRVAAFHVMQAPHGSFAEYALAPDWTTFHLPKSISFEAAATIPLAALTAAIGLFVDVQAPAPYDPKKPAEGEKVPVLIYGAGSAVGAFGAQFARLAGLKPIIGVAGASGEFVKGLVDYVVDYRQDEDAIVKGVEEALAKEGLPGKVAYVLDAISEKGSYEAIARVVDAEKGRVSHVLPPERGAKDGANFKHPGKSVGITTWVGQAHDAQKDFGYLWSRYISSLLEDGRLKTHPYEVVPGGLNGVSTGLKNLKEGKASGVKYVYRIEETEGVKV
ncbi:hypothetical protein HDV00_006191 [Rhizophlyctis rosea]|nr:hypothetical protein HDV00_006191 [Rhizophlyctis rosea]